MPAASCVNVGLIQQQLKKSEICEQSQLNLDITMNGRSPNISPVSFEQNCQGINVPGHGAGQLESGYIAAADTSKETCILEKNIDTRMTAAGGGSCPTGDQKNIVGMKSCTEVDGSDVTAITLENVTQSQAEQELLCAHLKSVVKKSDPNVTEGTSNVCVHECLTNSGLATQSGPTIAGRHGQFHSNKGVIADQTSSLGDTSPSARNDQVSKSVVEEFRKCEGTKALRLGDGNTFNVDEIRAEIHTTSKTFDLSPHSKDPSESCSSYTPAPVPCSSRASSSIYLQESVGGRISHHSDEGPSPEALKCPRKSLPLIPRINQYERHPLLQTRSGQRLSELEMFLQEKEEESLVRQNSTSSSGLRLIPRSAHSEPNPFLQRAAESGLCEIEQMLLDKEEELIESRLSKSESLRRNPRRDSDSVVRKPQVPPLQRRSTMGKLEPRASQCERHPLLEDRDEFGYSEIDRLLQEKNKELSEKGKCCAGRACKNSQCSNCKTARQQVSDTSRTSLQSPTTQYLPPAAAGAAAAGAGGGGGTSATAVRTASGCSRRVHFEGGESHDEDESLLPDSKYKPTLSSVVGKTHPASNPADGKPPGTVLGGDRGGAEKGANVAAKYTESNTQKNCSSKAIAKCKKARAKQFCCFK